jgi:hypothetical protein
MSRGHAKGPFSTQSNLRVQNVLTLIPGQTKQVFIEASETDPVFLRITPYVREASVNGANLLKVGTPSNDDAFIETGDVDEETLGFATEKKFVLVADITLIAVLSSTAIAATGTLTVTATTSADTQTVTIGATTYTFNTSLTNTANNVLIGADVTAMALNLTRAINAGAGAGTLYGTGTVANASVTATSVAGVVTLTAITAGTAGNSVATTETLTNSAFGAAALAGGEAVSSVGKIDLFVDA